MCGHGFLLRLLSQGIFPQNSYRGALKSVTKQNFMDRFLCRYQDHVRLIV